MDLRRTTASEELFRVLREQILSGRYAPGEKLPPQATLAAERRTEEQAEELRALAQVAAREQTADFTFFAGLVEASGNVVFSLILNSVRPIYFEHAAFFDGLITADQEAMYERAADAIARRDADAARAAVAELAERQERALEEALEA